MATTATAVPADPKHFVWWFPGSPVKVHLALQVVYRLKPHLSGNGDGRPVEGLLFGGVRDGATEILDFQPATNTAIPNLVASLTPERSNALIGYYRTEESSVFRLTAADRSLAESCFPKPHQVLLLIHGSNFELPAATFFFHNRDRQMADVAFLEFPFDAAALAMEERERLQRSRQSALELPAVPPPAPLPAAIPLPSFAVPRRERRLVLRIAAGVVLAVSLFAGGMLFNDPSLRDRISAFWAANWPHSSRSSTPPGEPTAPSRSGFSLHATRQSTDLELTWDRYSSVIASATSGLISIQDGNTPREISLDAAQLRSGSILYSPSSGQVEMKLSVTTPSATTSESVTAILPDPHPGDAGQPHAESGIIPYEPALAVVRIAPSFPPELADATLPRTVIQVKVTIDKFGKVSHAEAVPRPGISDLLLSSATQAAEKWKFRPAMRNHEPVAARSTLEFVFSR